MPRLKNAAGVVVSVSDATAKELLRRGFVSADEAETKPAAKKAAPRKSTK